MRRSSIDTEVTTMTMRGADDDAAGGAIEDDLFPEDESTPSEGHEDSDDGEEEDGLVDIGEGAEGDDEDVSMLDDVPNTDDFEIPDITTDGDPRELPMSLLKSLVSLMDLGRGPCPKSKADPTTSATLLKKLWSPGRNYDEHIAMQHSPYKHALRWMKLHENGNRWTSGTRWPTGINRTEHVSPFQGGDGFTS
nr:uncharacterized protein CI109_003610 [Kwoniella shandongensis]KAA5527956.1 hypothetical protein CI109_003610 [Kwoniella shandongensis]